MTSNLSSHNSIALSSSRPGISFCAEFDKISQLTLDTLKDDEGFRPLPYLCPAGKLTIGYGLNLETGITKDEAELILIARCLEIRKQLSEILPFWKYLTEPRQGVLINMAYNLGITGLLGFKNMLAALEDVVITGDYEPVIYHMLDSRWADQVGNREEDLIKIMREG